MAGCVFDLLKTQESIRSDNSLVDSIELFFLTSQILEAIFLEALSCPKNQRTSSISYFVAVLIHSAAVKPFEVSILMSKGPLD